MNPESSRERVSHMFTRALEPVADFAMERLDPSPKPGPGRSRTASPVPKINVAALSSPLKLERVPHSQDDNFIRSNNSRSPSQSKVSEAANGRSDENSALRRRDDSGSDAGGP